MTSLAARVKQDTLDLHASTERALAPFDLRTRDGYRAFLLVQAAAFLPLERTAERGGIARWLGDWPARRRGTLLLADLEALGAPAPDVAVHDVPDLDPLGVAYVLEGSRHGARILLRQVLESGGHDLAGATGFLAHAPAVGWWRRLQDALETYGTEAGRAEALITGARGAFALFERVARAGAPRNHAAASNEKRLGVVQPFSRAAP